ncbi:hypothetical protein WJX77_008024 [Trebouxia sp. C0004]
MRKPRQHSRNFFWASTEVTAVQVTDVLQKAGLLKNSAVRSVHRLFESKTAEDSEGSSKPETRRPTRDELPFFSHNNAVHIMRIKDIDGLAKETFSDSGHEKLDQIYASICNPKHGVLVAARGVDGGLVRSADKDQCLARCQKDKKHDQSTGSKPLAAQPSSAHLQIFAAKQPPMLHEQQAIRSKVVEFAGTMLTAEESEQEAESEDETESEDNPETYSSHEEDTDN